VNGKKANRALEWKWANETDTPTKRIKKNSISISCDSDPDDFQEIARTAPVKKSGHWHHKCAEFDKSLCIKVEEIIGFS
jgi:hypothetical protein